MFLCFKCLTIPSLISASDSSIGLLTHLQEVPSLPTSEITYHDSVKCLTGINKAHAHISSTL